MEKPQPITTPRYNYSECIDYITEKYGFYSERDFYGKQKKQEDNYLLAKEKTVEKFGIDTWRGKIPKDCNELEKECSKYFNQLCDEVKKSLPDDVDWWGDWVLENYEIHNGSFFTLEENDYGVKDRFDREEFEKIHGWLIEEFGIGEKGNRTIDFDVYW